MRAQKIPQPAQRFEPSQMQSGANFLYRGPFQQTRACKIQRRVIRGDACQMEKSNAVNAAADYSGGKPPPMFHKRRISGKQLLYFAGRLFVLQQKIH